MLKKLSEAVNSLDQAILKPYNEIAKNWEKKGRNIYNLSFFVGTLSIPLSDMSYVLFDKNGAMLLSFAQLPDRVYNFLGISGMTNWALTDALESINKNMRLATFIGGGAMMGKASYEVMQYFMHKEPSFESALEAAIIGTGLFLRASSMYLKDRSYMKNL